MFNITSNQLQVRLALEPADLRKSFGGLTALARTLEAEGNHQQFVWLFTNRSRNRIKMLHFDRSGVWVATKRLETGEEAKQSCIKTRKILVNTRAINLLFFKQTPKFITKPTKTHSLHFKRRHPPSKQTSKKTLP